MKNKIIIFCFFILSSVSFAAPLSNSTKAVAVEVELEEMPEVQKYEIELKSKIKKKEKSVNFIQATPSFKVKLEVGNYQLRTRIVSSKGEVGPWSDWSELLARPEEVGAIEITAAAYSVRKNQTFTEIKLKWSKALGADQYMIWAENLLNGKITKIKSGKNETLLKLSLGEYKIGIQSVSKDGIKSQIKYTDETIYITKTILPKIQLKQDVKNLFSWVKQPEAEVKIEVFRKPFFGEKYIKIRTLKESGESWRLAGDLAPGEYKIDFQYISEAFENGPIESVTFLKKPDEKNFSTENK